MASSLLVRMRRSPCPIGIFQDFDKSFTAFGVRLRRLPASLFCRLVCAGRWVRTTVLRACLLLAAYLDPFWVMFLYLASNSFMGFIQLRIVGQKQASPTLRDLDLLFTSVSAVTVSSMSTVEMEGLSRGQLAVVGLLMLLSGEVVTSILPLQLTKAKLLREAAADASGSSTTGVSAGSNKDGSYQVELGSVAVSPLRDVEAADDNVIVDSDWKLKYKSASLLGTVVLWYNAVFLLLGSASVLLYLNFVSGGGARDVLSEKGIHTIDFSVFLSVSSFANVGFVPTNEGMLPFRKNSCLLLLITPLVLAGNTLFPVCLRSVLCILRTLLRERAEPLDYLLSRTDGRLLGFDHLLSKTSCIHLVLTAAAFLVVQFVLFCCMEWNSDAVGGGMSAYEKAVAVIFQSVNSRHAGESVFDLSMISPAILVLYLVMMYLPPYTWFSPVEVESPISEGKRHGITKKSSGLLPRSLIFSQLSYIAIFVILVCISERRKLVEDPLNFNVFSIVVEVVSAYGNVGFSTGYSCRRQLRPGEGCKDRWYGFVGRWSDSGKLILIAVMFFGRLKKFNKRGGRAWKLS